MAPLIEVSERTLKGLEQLGISYTLKESQTDNNSIHVPSMKFSGAKQRTHFNTDWLDSHKVLAREEVSMITIPEFVEFLKYAKSDFPKIFEEITGVRNPWRAEWLDAYFEKRKDGMYILTGNKTKAEKLDRNTLMEDKRISLESWLDNPTKQGLPTQETKSGDLYYWYPRSDSVARFYADSGRVVLDCNRDSNDLSSNLGVRAVRR